MGGRSVPSFDSKPLDSLTIEASELDGMEGAVVFHLKGYIDTYNSHAFQRKIANVVDGGYRHLVFHCGGLGYISSTGIGAFVALLKQLENVQGDVALVQVQPKVYEVFQILGFSEFFAFADDIDHARRMLVSGRARQKVTPFPRSFACPICSSRLRAKKAGRFRCSKCKTILLVDSDAQVYLG